MSHPYHLLFSLLLFLFLTKTNGNPVNSTIPNCPSPTCGNLTIKYPFWLSSQNPDFCGYPSFNFTCNAQQKLIFHLPNDNYYVTNINYSRNTLTLVDIDVIGKSCPRVPHNVTLEPVIGHLNYSALDENLTFYFNCTDYHSLDGDLPCLSNGRNHSFMFRAGTIPKFDWFLYCEDCVVAPILEYSEVDVLTTGAFGGLLEKGFELGWSSVLDCAVCEESKGYCGNNKSNGEFICFCKDGPHARFCYRDGKRDNNKKKIIAVAIGAGVGALLLFLALLVFFLCRRSRNKNGPSISSNLLSRSISSDPYSKSELEKGIHTQVFEYKELEEATNNFDPSKELGDGGFGTVYHGKLRDGRFVAVKRLYENNYKRVEQFKNEIDILSRLRHRNLVTLYGCSSRHRRELLLVYEFIPNGTVADHLHGDRVQAGTLTWSIRMSIAVETADALAYLHKVEIIHRDVKTNNILLDNNFCVKVADFGLSRLFPLDVTHVSTAPQGTPGYVDPDYHRCYQLTDRSDVYSFGVVLIELISSMPAVDISRHRHEINLASMAITKIHNNALHELVDSTLGFDSDFSVRRMITSVAQLAFRCLQEEKEVRPSMEEVLEELRGIESEEYKVEKIEEVGIPVDETALLKNNLPPSPDTVTKAWDSRTTTPNTSG